jgi:hypothetical protein
VSSVFKGIFEIFLFFLVFYCANRSAAAARAPQNLGKSKPLAIELAQGVLTGMSHEKFKKERA